MLLQAKSLLAAAKKQQSMQAAATSTTNNESTIDIQKHTTERQTSYATAPSNNNHADDSRRRSSNSSSTTTTNEFDMMASMVQQSSQSGASTSMTSSDEDATGPLSEVSLQGVQDDDVLCGRSEVSHIGNKKYRRIIEGHREAYQNASSRRKKTELSWQIILKIRQGGGRFLKMDDETGEWQELDDKQAKEKVSHALRSAKDPDRPRMRKPRVVKKHIPTAKEEMLYHHILRDQQELFRSMMKREGCDVNDLVLR